MVVQAPSSSSPYCKNTRGSKEALKAATYSLRLTFMQRDLRPIPAARLLQEYTLICDKLISKGEEVDLQISLSAGNKFVMRVEAFDPKTKELKYVGQSQEVDLTAERAVIYLRPTGKITCADPARHPRAFHSATLLPDGKVLLMGGLVSDTTLGRKLHVAAAEEYAYATGTVEIYDPETMTFQDVDGSIPARAFHRAHLVPSSIDESFEILVVGGVKSSTTPAGPAFRLRAASNYNYPYLVSPHEKSEAAEALLVTYTPAKVKGQKPTLKTKTLSALPRLMMPQSVEIPATSQVLFSEGGATYTTTGSNKSFTAGTAFWVDLKDKASRKGADPRLLAKAPLARTRVGHSVVPLGPSRYLVFGGTVNRKTCTSDKDPQCDADAAEWLNFSSGKPASAVITYSSFPQTTVWQSMTTIGLTDAQLAPKAPQVPKTPDKALLAGGFPLIFDTGSKMQLAWDQWLPKKTLQLLLDSSGQPGAPPSHSTVPTSGEGHFLASEYHAAIRLADGSVMLSGGNVNSNFEKKEACKTSTSAFCAYRQIVVYKFKGGTGVVLGQSAKMTIGRFGHSATRLLDNTVLISGGISLFGSRPELLQHAEIYNPRTGDASEDPFGRLPVAVSPGSKCLVQD